MAECVVTTWKPKHYKTTISRARV